MAQVLGSLAPQEGHCHLFFPGLRCEVSGTHFLFQWAPQITSVAFPWPQLFLHSPDLLWKGKNGVQGRLRWDQRKDH